MKEHRGVLLSVFKVRLIPHGDSSLSRLSGLPTLLLRGNGGLAYRRWLIGSGITGGSPPNIVPAAKKMSSVRRVFMNLRLIYTNFRFIKILIFIPKKGNVCKLILRFGCEWN